MTAARRVAIGQPQAGLLLSDPLSRALLRASGAGKKHVAACAAADHKSGLDRPQRLTGYESRPGRSVGRLAVVTAELFFHSSLWRRHSSTVRGRARREREDRRGACCCSCVERSAAA
jgi:hypothetical protein